MWRLRISDLRLERNHSGNRRRDTFRLRTCWGFWPENRVLHQEAWFFSLYPSRQGGYLLQRWKIVVTWYEWWDPRVHLPSDLWWLFGVWKPLFQLFPSFEFQERFCRSFLAKNCVLKNKFHKNVFVLTNCDDPGAIETELSEIMFLNLFQGIIKYQNKSISSASNYSLLFKFFRAHSGHRALMRLLTVCQPISFP